MMRNIIFISFLLTQLAQPSSAQEIILPDFKGWATTDMKGAGVEILNTLLTPNTQNNIILSVYPLLRGINRIKSKKASCFFPSQKRKFNELTKNELIESHPVRTNKVRVFTLKQIKPPSSLKEIKNKKISILMGLDQISELKPIIAEAKNITLYTRLNQGIKQILSKRSDYIIFMEKHHSNELRNKFHYDKDFIISSIKDSLVCLKSKKTESLIQEFNKNYNLNKKKIEDLFRKSQSEI